MKRTPRHTAVPTVKLAMAGAAGAFLLAALAGCVVVPPDAAAPDPVATPAPDPSARQPMTASPDSPPAPARPAPVVGATGEPASPAASSPAWREVSHELDATLQPDAGRVTVADAMVLEPVAAGIAPGTAGPAGSAAPTGPVRMVVRLPAGATSIALTDADGKPVPFRRLVDAEPAPGADGDGPATPPGPASDGSVRLAMEREVLRGRVRLSVRYELRAKSPAPGEVPAPGFNAGGEDELTPRLPAGIALDGEGAVLPASTGWTPTVEPSARTTGPLPRFGITARIAAGWTVISHGTLAPTGLSNGAPGAVAGGSERSGGIPDGEVVHRFRPEHPTDGASLLAVRRQTVRRPAGRVMIELHHRPESRDRAAEWLRTAEELLADYERLLGPYPGSRLAIVEDVPALAGAASPAAGIVAAPRGLGAGGLLPGGLDRSMVAGWFGAGVFRDPADGDWTGPLCRWLADYVQTAAAGPEAAAAYRAGLLRAWSAWPDQRAGTDLPLALAGRGRAAAARPATGNASVVDGMHPGDGGRRAALAAKGVMTFHMLVSRIRPERFFAGLRRLRESHTGRRAGWADLQAALEERPEELRIWFAQWVREAGAPRLRLQGVRVPAEPGATPAPGSAGSAGPVRLSAELVQTGRVFRLDVPVTVTLADGRVERRVVPASRRVTVFEIECPARPTVVELDPDWDVMRTLPADELPATIGAAWEAGPPVVWLCRADAEDLQRAMRATVAALGVPATHVRTVNAPADLTMGRLADGPAGSVVLAGGCARSPAAAELLAAARSRAGLAEGGFTWDGNPHTGAGEGLVLAVPMTGAAAAATSGAAERGATPEMSDRPAEGRANPGPDEVGPPRPAGADGPAREGRGSSGPASEGPRPPVRASGGARVAVLLVAGSAAALPGADVLRASATWGRVRFDGGRAVARTTDSPLPSSTRVEIGAAKPAMPRTGDRQ